MNIFKTKTPINPMIPTMVSMTVQVDSVSFTERLKYSLNIQKPPSFTCDNIKLPEPMASTINSGLTPVFAAIGKTIPAAVNPATVADPTQTLRMVAINHAKISGDMLEFFNKSPI